MARTKKQEEATEQVMAEITGESTEVKDAAAKKFNRDPQTGLIDGIRHVFCKETGLVDWRKMVDREFLVPNAVKFSDGTNLKELNVDDLDDNQLLILLGGIKNLAQLRGYSKVEYKVHHASQGYVSVSCGIEWIPNFETDGKAVYFEALADAHFENTKSFARDFLMAVAENRAFTRAVRNFLRINIVGSDEMGDLKKGAGAVASEEAASKPVSAYDPTTVLSKLMNETKITFETIQKRLADEGQENAMIWAGIADIPKDQVFKLIERIKKKVKG